jgi:hypothetical protein
MPRETYSQTFGAKLQLVCFILLLALVPYSLYSGYWLYVTISTWSDGPVGFLLYPLARVVACVILFYALWKLRKTGLRLRNAVPPIR